MNGTEDDPHLLDLGADVVQFEAVTKINNVFYDEVTSQVLTVRSGGATGVVVRGHKLKTALNFRVEDKGAVLSIKFSPNQQILAIQRSARTVEFLNFVDQEPDGPEYSQQCRGSTSTIIGFVWVSDTDFIVVTNQGTDHYQISPKKRTVRSVKSYSLLCNWFVYCPGSSMLVVSFGPLGTDLQPCLFKNQQLVRLAKFQVEVASTPQPARLCLQERDVTVTTLYNQSVVLVLKHQTTSAEILVYSVTKESARKTHILQLETSGKLAVSIVNNLVIVHHQASKTSSLFDLQCSGIVEGRVTHLNAFISHAKMRPFIMPSSAGSTAVLLNSQQQQHGCEMYSPNWIFFQPNVIIDAILGCLWTLQIRLVPTVLHSNLFESDPCQLFDFLLRRSDSKAAVIGALQKLLDPNSSACDVGLLGNIFDKLNENYRNMLDIEMASQMATPASSPLQMKQPTAVVQARPNVVIDQNDLYTRVLTRFNSQVWPQRDARIIAILNEYIRSLVQFHIPTQHFIYEMIIDALVRSKQFYQLHQLFQYHAVADSKPLVRHRPLKPSTSKLINTYSLLMEII